MIDNNEVLRMLSEGKKQKDIAKHFGVSPVAIHKRVKKIRAQAESKDKGEINQGDVTHTHDNTQECFTTSEPKQRKHKYPDGRYMLNTKEGTLWSWTKMLAKNKDELHLREVNVVNGEVVQVNHIRS